MPKHFEQAPGLYDAPVPETEGYVFNQTMMRIKEPERSLDFYTRVMGMRLVRKLDFPEMKFTLYFIIFGTPVVGEFQHGFAPEGVGCAMGIVCRYRLGLFVIQV